MIDTLLSAKNEIIGGCITALLIAMSKKIYSLTKEKVKTKRIIDMNNTQIFLQNKNISDLQLTNKKLQSVIDTQNLYINQQNDTINDLKLKLKKALNTQTNTTQGFRSHKNVLTIGQTQIVEHLNNVYGEPADNKDWLAWPAGSRTNKVMLEKIVDESIILRFSFDKQNITQTLHFLSTRNYKHWEDKGGSGKSHRRFHVCFPLDMTQMDIQMLDLLLQNCI